MVSAPLKEWHPFWSLSAFDRRYHAHQDGRGSARRYPIRLLRYWFMDHLLRQEASALGRGLDVCEVGVGGGQLLEFVSSSAEAHKGTLPAWINAWDGLSKGIDRWQLSKLGYSNCYDADIEKSIPKLAEQYDALVLLHILEHLYSPEQAVAQLLPYVRPGGVILGGCPTLPDLLRPMREQQLRKKAEPYGHVSVISARRMKQMAKSYGLEIQFITGAYLVRASGTRIEDSRAWLRFNLIVSSLMTGWVGELYWALRKPMSVS
jgi:SAM-dependent methyltransferase